MQEIGSGEVQHVAKPVAGFQLEFSTRHLRTPCKRKHVSNLNRCCERKHADRGILMDHRCDVG